MSTSRNSSVAVGGAADLAFAAVTAAALAWSMYASFVHAPTDAAQGDVQRLFYLHLGMWLPTFTAFIFVAFGSVLYLWRKDLRWDRFARCSAEVGLLFCTLGLATGSIWGKPIWNTWWTWDPRLTFTLILWMIYAAYLLLRTLSSDPNQGANLAAILGVSGVADLYIIHQAVYWWGGIHPAVIRTREGSTGLKDWGMRIALLSSLFAFALLFSWLLRARTRLDRVRDCVEDMREQLARN